MSIRDMVEKEDVIAAEIFTSMIEKGTIRKRTLPNTSSEFSDEKALENARYLSESGDFDKIMTDAYKGNE